MYGLTRGLMTLFGVAVAGGLIWLASWFGPRDSARDYWIAMALVAGAGLVMALSQLLGGWTKWGAPRISIPVLLLGFLPALIVGGWVVVAAQPSASGAKNQIAQWSSDIGIGGLVSDVTPLVGAIAFGIGLVFGLIFDTTGARRRDVVEDGRYVDDGRTVSRDREYDRAGYNGREGYPADEPVAAERRRTYDGDRTYDGGRTYDGETAVERPATQPVGIGTRDEQATPSAPQPEPEAEPRRRSFFRR